MLWRRGLRGRMHLVAGVLEKPPERVLLLLRERVQEGPDLLESRGLRVVLGPQLGDFGPHIRVWRKGRGGRREEWVRSRVSLAHRLDHIGREFFVNRVPRVDRALPPRPELPVELRHLALALRDGHRALPERPQDVGTHGEATGPEQVPNLTGDA